MKLLILLLAAVGLAAPAQNIRYQHGDDPQWADPKFDDSSWQQASPGKFPIPSTEGSRGMVWLRFRVAVPPDQSPLAIRLARENGTCTPGELWVNGILAGTQGRLPPRPQTRKICETNVFDVSKLAAPPGETVVVAWRGLGGAHLRLRDRLLAACVVRP
jgi:hypothetical protein